MCPSEFGVTEGIVVLFPTPIKVNLIVFVNRPEFYVDNQSQEPDKGPDSVATLALLNEKSQENAQLTKEINTLHEALAVASVPRPRELELERELEASLAESEKCNQRPHPAHYLLDRLGVHTAAETLHKKQDRLRGTPTKQAATRTGRKRAPRSWGVIRLQFHWSPGHMAFGPNERADKLAKVAGEGESSSIHLLPRFLRTKPLPVSIPAIRHADLVATQVEVEEILPHDADPRQDVPVEAVHELEDHQRVRSSEVRHPDTALHGQLLTQPAPLPNPASGIPDMPPLPRSYSQDSAPLPARVPALQARTPLTARGIRPTRDRGLAARPPACPAGLRLALPASQTAGSYQGNGAGKRRPTHSPRTRGGGNSVALAPGFVTSVREENAELQKEAQIAREQAPTGVEAVKPTYVGCIKALEDDARTLKRLALFMMEKDIRTNDEIRRTAEEPELRARCEELMKDLRHLRNEIVDLQEDVDDKYIKIQELEQQLRSCQRQATVLNADLTKVKSLQEGEDKVYQCGWRVDDVAIRFLQRMRSSSDIWK
ncbi:hypothetical protein C0995_014892 [Termitomyces sp. Mi166|nr:hypothetical protein C0995_014892 [Termitomyces sp. Mi166\